jgi:hypothetical protein
MEYIADVVRDNMLTLGMKNFHEEVRFVTETVLATMPTEGEQHGQS